MQHYLLLLVILNPFSQVLFLRELMKVLSVGDFARVHLRASLLSFSIFALFALVGEPIMEFFSVRLGSLRIFGGLIMLVIAYRYIAQGEGANLMFRGDLEDLAPEISLPYMVGPGTLWASMYIGNHQIWWTALVIIGAVVATNFLVMIVVRRMYFDLEKQGRTMLGKYFAILMRTNALFIGGIGIEMIMRGFQEIEVI